jgi:hypothetical protein
MIGGSNTFGIRAGCALALGLLCVSVSTAYSQYFGRNKVNYESFDFQVLHTEHFDLHFYPRSNVAAQDAGRMAERWYARLSPAFGQEFKKTKPLILYADHADFQQTNVISGFLGEGTGGVTEPVKNRVVMPLTGDYAGTDHVLGHEIVHVFQFDIAFSEDDSIPFRLQLLPLWLIEGMAEYLSVGREDPHTAMWLRDAVLQDEFPTIKQLTTDPRFFPYRYGQALWAYVGGRWGDDTIGEIYRAAGRRGLEFAFAKVLGVTTDSLSSMWETAVRETYTPAMEGRAKPGETGKRLLAPDIDSGEINLAPVLSPDGTHVAFLSERDLFSIDVFIADAATGKVERKLVSASTNSHFDALRFIDSAGTWSPDGTRFALVVFAKGDNEILVVDTESGGVKKRFKPKKVGAISNPAWSPDGKWIAFSGSDEGQSDLYLVEVATGKVTRLNDDRYADLQPAWSPDGSSLAFVTDRGPDTDFDELVYGPMVVGLRDMDTGRIRLLAPLKGAKHINPQFSADGRSVYFISDREGFSDIYRVSLDTEDVYQVTHMATGVSGITALSPALTVASTGRIQFSAFEEEKYIVYSMEAGEAGGHLVISHQNPLVALPWPGTAPGERAAAAPDTLNADEGSGDPGLAHRNPTVPFVIEPSDRTADGEASSPRPGTSASRARSVYTSGQSPAGKLPPAEDQGRVLVSDYLSDPEGGLPEADSFTVSQYHPKLQLDYVGAFSVGGVVVDRFGTAIGGGATAYFSDMLGNHTVGVGLQANGTFKDIGGQAFYVNRDRRLNWGAVAGHVPYLNYFTSLHTEGDTLVYQERRERVYLDRASLFTAYPFSPTRRVEASVGFTRYGFDLEVQEQRLYSSGGVSDITTRELDSPDPLNLFQTSVALVGDNSFFGFTSPIQGQRYRLEIEPTWGTLNFQNLLVDYRRYLLLRPFTVAGRMLHLGRYGVDGEDDRLSPLFIGYGTLVRGYSAGSFDFSECGEDPNCPEYDRLLGSRIAVTNLEVRFPLVGTSQYGLINFPYLPTELSAFLDGGVAWFTDEKPEFRFATDTQDRIPVFSAGGSARFNILGALVLEMYLAFPFQRPQKASEFGIQIVPGW